VNYASKENIGIIFGILAFLLFASSDVLQKYATIHHTVFQIIFFRYLFFFIISITESRRKKNKSFWKTNNFKLQILRSFISLIETIFFVTSFKYLSLASVHSVAALAPIFVVILSIFFLKEYVERKIWIAIFAGFFGVLIILRPGFEVFNLNALLPLGAGFFFAFYQILTKKVSETDSDETSLFYTSIFGLVIIGTLALIYWNDFTIFSFFILPLIVMNMISYISAIFNSPNN